MLNRMRHSRDRRRAAAGLYVLLGATIVFVALASNSVLLLVLGIAFLPLAAWAVKEYPVDNDW